MPSLVAREPQAGSVLCSALGSVFLSGLAGESPPLRTLLAHGTTVNVPTAPQTTSATPDDDEAHKRRRIERFTPPTQSETAMGAAAPTAARIAAGRAHDWSTQCPPGGDVAGSTRTRQARRWRGSPLLRRRPLALPPNVRGRRERRRSPMRRKTRSPARGEPSASPAAPALSGHGAATDDDATDDVDQRDVIDEHDVVDHPDDVGSLASECMPSSRSCWIRAMCSSSALMALSACPSITKVPMRLTAVGGVASMHSTPTRSAPRRSSTRTSTRNRRQGGHRGQQGNAAGRQAISGL